MACEVAIAAASVFLDVYNTHGGIESERLDREAAIQQLRQQSKAEVDALQQQINQLHQNPSAGQR